MGEPSSGRVWLVMGLFFILFGSVMAFYAVKKFRSSEAHLPAIEVPALDPKVSAITEEISNETEAAGLREILERTLALAPRNEEKANDTGEQLLSKGASDFAEIVGELESHLKSKPVLIEEAIRFYRRCGRDVSIEDSTRSLCTANYFDHLIRLKRKLDISEFDATILHDAKDIMTEKLPNVEAPSHTSTGTH